MSLVLALWVCASPLACSTRSSRQSAPSNGDLGSLPARLVIEGVRLRSMTGADTSAPRTVIVEGERIAQIVDADAAEWRASDQVIDGSGQFLIPGLADMHSHAVTPEDIARYVAHGVTTLRIMQGFATHLAMRDSVAAGRSIGPALVVASPMMDGDPPAYPELIPVHDAAEARERVKGYHGSGYDQIKLYHNLSADAFLAAIEQAHALGMKAVGHAPIALSGRQAYEAGYDSCEHLSGMLRDLQKQPVELARDTSSTEWALRMAANADPAGARALAGVAEQHGTWLVPTLRMHRVLEASPEQWQSWSEEAKVGQISNAIKQRWTAETEARADMDPKWYADGDRAWSTLLAIVREIHSAGAELLVGTDFGMPYLYAGEAVHEELRAFVEAGFEPREALAAATAKPAQFLDQSGQFGTIQVGARADLVLLHADPFASLDALDEISGVAVRGHWLDREALDRVLETGTLPQPDNDLGQREACSVKASGGVATIEDFDDGDPYIAGDSRRGMWFDFDDGSGGEQAPTGSAWQLTDGGVNSQGLALRVTGGGFTSWGSGLGVNLAWNETENRACAYDASVWDGLSFWAKGNVDGFAVGLAELDVTPVEQGGRCTSMCYGTHRVEVDLDDCWRRYAFSFSEFDPVDWSPENGPLNASELTALQFYVYTGAAPNNRYEYWVDQIEFYAGEKPAGAANCNGGAGGAP